MPFPWSTVGNLFQLENWYYVPLVNLFAQLFDIKDPPSPEELSEALNGAGLIGTLVLGIVISIVQAFGYEDYMEAIDRLEINATTGENNWEDGADPYSVWVIATTESIAALMLQLFITVMIMIHQSTTDFHDPVKLSLVPPIYEYSVDLRRAWWKYVRFAQLVNVFLLLYGSYAFVTSFEMSAFMMLPMLPTLGGSVHAGAGSSLAALFDSEWTQTHKYNFAAMFLTPLGKCAVLTFFSFICVSWGMGNKHYAKQKMLVKHNNKNKKQEGGGEPNSTQVAPESAEDKVSINVTLQLLNDLIRKQGETQSEILKLVSKLNEVPVESSCAIAL
jgi:hypothetical protein